MAKGSIMLQVEVTQQIDGTVTSVPALSVRAFEFLSFGTTTVREISAQKEGGILAAPAVSLAGWSNTPYAVLSLFLRGGEEISFLAPSHVPSPQFEAGFAILEIIDGGVASTDSAELSVARRIGGHAYLEEVDNVS